MTEPKTDELVGPFKIKKTEHERGEPAWERMANNVARNFVGGMDECKTCGRPRVQRYCCTFCGGE
jgi:hypothetical protein